MSSSFLAAAIIQAVTMASGILSARLLHPQGKGELTAVMLWPSLFASVGSLGVIEAGTYLTADQPAESSRILATTLAVIAGLSALLMAIGYFLIPEVLAGYGASIIGIAQQYLVFIPLSLVTLSLMGFLLGRLQFVRYNALRVLGHVSTAVGMVGLYAVGRVSVHSFALVSLGSGVLTAGVALAFALRNGGLGWMPHLPTLRRLIGYGLRCHVGAVAAVLNLRLDQMLMSVFLPASTLGLYVVAVTVSSAAALGANTVSLVAFPSITNARTDDAKRRALGQYARLTLMLSVVTTALLFWLTPWILLVFFGSSFVPAVMMARVLIVATVPLASNIVLAAGLKAFNCPQIVSYGEAVSLVVTGVALAILLPAFQGLGAAWASLFAYLATSGFLLWRLNEHLGISPAELLWPGRDDWRYVVGQLGTVRQQFLGTQK